MAKHPRIYRSAIDHKYYHVRGNPDESRVFEAAGLVMRDDISAIEAVVILDEVLGLARPQYKLRPICRAIPMDMLTANIEVATGLTGQEKVKRMQEAEIQRQAYTKVPFDLWKNVVHVAIEDESEMRTRHNLMQMHTADAGRDLPRMENKQIAEALDLCDKNVGAGGNWDTFTTGVSDNNPFPDLVAAFNSLAGEGFQPELAVMHPNVWSGFILNTYVKELVQAGIATVGRDGGSFTIPGYPTVNVLTDFAVLPITSCYILSTSAPALVLGTGPTMAARYREEKAGYDAYIIRQWLEPKIIDHGANKDPLYEITGAHS